MWGIVIYQWRLRIMGKEEVIISLFIAPKMHMMIFLRVRAPSLPVHVQETALCVFYCQMHHFCLIFISPTMRERSNKAVFTPTAMAFQNILVWKQYRSLCRCSFLIAFLMPVTSLLTMLPHPSCHLWTPASSDSKVVTKLHGGRPKMQVLPRMCRKMWVMIHLPTMSVTLEMV